MNKPIFANLGSNVNLFLLFIFLHTLLFSLFFFIIYDIKSLHFCHIQRWSKINKETFNTVQTQKCMNLQHNVEGKCDRASPLFENKESFIPCRQDGTGFVWFPVEMIKESCSSVDPNTSSFVCLQILLLFIIIY